MRLGERRRARAERRELTSLVHFDAASYDADERPGAVLVSRAGAVLARRLDAGQVLAGRDGSPWSVSLVPWWAPRSGQVAGPDRAKPGWAREDAGSNLAVLRDELDPRVRGSAPVFADVDRFAWRGDQVAGPRNPMVRHGS
jgi:hypothetical protein